MTVELSKAFLRDLQNSNELNFYVNGQLQTVNVLTLTPDTTLNQYIREVVHLTGTKCMCLQGGCGSCIVTATIANPRTGAHETLAVNSCLVVVLSCEGWRITTAEGLGNRYDGYHPIQQKIVQFNGTQCGFCTPGMVMNMYALLEEGKMTMAEIEDSFGGNICRCTGFRPILTAFKSIASDTDAELLGKVDTFDIEDYVPCWKVDNCKSVKSADGKCQEKCRIANAHSPKILKPVILNGKWIRVETVADIFAIFHHPDYNNKTYELVAGNTAKAIYPELAKKDIYIDISNVKELKSKSLSTSALTLGANCTLADTMQIFKDIADDDDGFVYLPKIIAHFNLIASVPVRNIGTLAGNLFMKYCHHEFPSDIFVLLETIGAKVIIYNGQKKIAMLPSEFLGVDMFHQIILNIQLPPISEEYKLETYKIMPRSQNALAIVNAGFLFKLSSDNIVDRAKIIYGGIDPSFIHAQQAETFATGKQLFNNANMQKLFVKLSNELSPDNIIPDASPEYRKGLAIALLYKFILSIAPTVSPNFVSGGDKLVRPPVSTGVQDFTTNKSMYPIGEPITKLEAADQASGAAKYVTDLMDLPGQLHAAFVLGQARPGSILLGMNADDALALPGVEAFLTAEDIPGNNSFMALTNPLLYHVDEPIFIDIGDEIKFYFQPVGIILATSRKIALEAVDLVRVTFEYSENCPLLNIQDVLSHGDSNRITHQETFVAKHQCLDAPIQFEGTFATSGHYHFHMELQVANAEPDDDGGFIIHPSSQWMSSMQYALTKAINIPSNKLTLITKRIGGAFGAKITRAAWTCCAATMAALKLRKPVKFYMNLSQNMKTIGKRDPFVSKYEVGVNEDGVIGYFNNDLYHDVGSYANWQLLVYATSVYMSTYNTDAFQLDTYNVQTDIQSPTSARAPGSLEAVAILESVMDQIALKTNKDPIDIRLANLDAIKNPLLIKLVKDCQTWSDYRSRRAVIETFNENNRWRKKGIAISCMAFNLVFVGTTYSQVSIYQDGTVMIMHGAVEFGQGVNTKAAQTAAYILGVDIKLVTIKATDTFCGPSQYNTAGSCTTEAVCYATKSACANLKARIDAAAEKGKLPDDASWNAKVQYAYSNGVSLTENQTYEYFPYPSIVIGVKYFRYVDNPNDSSNYLIYGVAVSEVEIDILTGQTIISRVDLMEDCGDSMNPAIDIGQVEGAFVMGIGLWMTEQLKFNEEGELKTIDTWTYHPPGAKDIPVDFRVKLPDGIPNPISPFKTKATTEPPICLAVSVPLAIRHALKTARLESDRRADPWVEFDGPSTMEWTFLNSLPDYKQYKL